MKFIDTWNEYKKQYTFGKHYIDVDCGEYIAICPAIFEVMNGLHFMRHCVTCEKCYFRDYFRTYLSYEFDRRYDKNIESIDGIKVFFILKNLDINNQDNKPTDEFTGWILPHSKHKNYLTCLHDINNHICSPWNEENFEEDFIKYQTTYEPFKTIVEINIQKIINEFDKYKPQLRFETYKNIICPQETWTNFKRRKYYKTFILNK